MTFDFFHSKFFTGVAVVALVLIVLFLGKEFKKGYEINREIAALHREIVDMEAENRQSLELINYFKTTEYQERQARLLLNLQKPGELVVALPFQESQPLANESAREAGSSNLKMWWEYFFGR
jgi:cell division protein FtsB